MLWKSCFVSIDSVPPRARRRSISCFLNAFESRVGSGNKPVSAGCSCVMELFGFLYLRFPTGGLHRNRARGAGAFFEELRSPSGLPSLPKTALTSLSKPKTIYTEDVTEPFILALR